MKRLGSQKSLKGLIKVGFCAVALVAVLVVTGCYEPSPLYGAWQDNSGNTIRFVEEGKQFTAKIFYKDINDLVKNKDYQGTYSVLENTLTLSYTNTADPSDSGSMNTEWDMRGSILYLTWTSKLSSTEEPETVVLTLYHVSK